MVPLLLDVVIRTQAEATRSKLLFRALDSIQDQRGVTARPIVVVNGNTFDAATVDELRRRRGIVLHQESIASIGIAGVAGRRLVTAPYFTYLDDDDELIPGSLLTPLQFISDHAECDVLISNGYLVRQDGTTTELNHIRDHIKLGNPALSLLQDSWLMQGAFICRTASVPLEMLGAEPNSMEWTQLAFELCARHKRLSFMDIPTTRYYDRAGSLSKQTRYRKGELDLLKRVGRDNRLGHDVRLAARRKYVRALHNLVSAYLNDRKYGSAWRCHVQSLRPPYTFRYLLFSRKLLFPAAKRHR